MFFGVEIILREFSVDALFTVMLSAMIADVVAIPFLGDKPFLSGFPAGIALHHASNYLLVAVLAVVAALIGPGVQDRPVQDRGPVRPRCGRAGRSGPGPPSAGSRSGLLLLALPQMYGVGYPVMYKATAGEYALWFLIVLAVRRRSSRAA